MPQRTAFLAAWHRSTARLSTWTALLFIAFIALSNIPAALAESPVQTYDALVSAIRSVRHETEARIETAVEQEKVREAWQTGKLIHEHILLNKDRAEYGQQVLKKLSGDLGTSETELNYMVQFARSYTIFPSTEKLPWGHYRELLSINDEEERRKVAKQASEKHWTQKEIRDEVRKRNNSSLPTLHSSLPEVKPGKVGVYRIIDLRPQTLDSRPKQLYLDLGFSIYHILSKEDQKRFKAEDLVQISKKGLKSSVSGLESLYTYNATVDEIYDGDTFYAFVELDKDTIIRQQLRLRRIDAPELVEAEGKEAKSALEKILMKDKGRILIKTSKGEDQFGRYLVDIWVKEKSIEQELLNYQIFNLRFEV